ncbi:MAG: AbrB/MazE/SpoVT family DNA-binding domain-containing protein [Candidatus Methylomirabilia bacterium]
MRTRVVTWGNSLAVRIPKTYAGELGLVSEAEVDLAIDQGTIVLAPVAPYRVSLKSLLDEITDENIHREVDTSGPEGDEAW